MALISTLIDDFNTGVFDTVKWQRSSSLAVVVTNTTKKVAINATAAGNWFESIGAFDLTNSSVYANVVAPYDTTGNIFTTVQLLDSVNHVIATINLTGSLIQAQVYGSGAFTLSADPNNTWWRIRHSGSTIYFDLSTDGVNWFTRGSGVPTLPVTGLNLFFYAAVGTATTPVPVVTVDNVNVMPTASSAPSVNNSPTKQVGFTGDTTKSYLYKVYNQAMTFIGVWKDVISEPQFTQPINTPGTTMEVKLARSPDETQEVRDNLKAQDGTLLTTQGLEQLVVKSQQSNVVGSGSDADIAYFVDVYVTYGGYEPLTTQSGEPLTTQDGEQLLVAVGAPLGRRIFSGFILDYESDYGGASNNSNVTVTLASNGYELSQDVVRDSGAYTNTTKSFSGIAGESIISTIVNTNPGRMTTIGSLATSGVSISPTFQLTRKSDAIQMCVDQMGSNFYWYGSPADNNVYMGLTGVTPNHTFVQGKHLSSVQVKRTMENMINDFYFVAGTPAASPQLYKHYIDPGGSLTSWRRGLSIKIDQRYLLTASTDKVATSTFNKFAQPLYTTTITLSAATYDIETVQLGQLVTFRNFGNFVDGLVLQIVNRSYTPYSLTLDLGSPLPSSNDLVTEVEQEANTTAFQALPTSPS